MRKLFFAILFISIGSFAQKRPGDSLFLMNGRIVVSPVIDTLFGAATFVDPDDTTKRAHIENDQLFAIRYNNGDIFYYYKQDTIRNWFSREEMWLFMQGERDAKAGFKPWGSFWTALGAGALGGITGTILGPIAPATVVSVVGLPWIRIKHKSVSNPNYLEFDSYILGYEREARGKRRIYALIGSGVGLVLGYSTYFLWLKNEPKFPF